MARSRSRSAPPDEVSVEIDAPASTVWSLVTDVSGMGRLSPECTGGRWMKGASGPAVGARFRGRNRRGLARWSTTNVVVAAEPDREFAFETKQSGARWRYLIDSDGGRTRVTETREMYKRRPLSARLYAKVALGGLEPHEDEMRTGMRATLDRLKALAEQPDPTR